MIEFFISARHSVVGGVTKFNRYIWEGESNDVFADSKFWGGGLSSSAVGQGAVLDIFISPRRVTLVSALTGNRGPWVVVSCGEVYIPAVGRPCIPRWVNVFQFVGPIRCHRVSVGVSKNHCQLLRSVRSQFPRGCRRYRVAVYGARRDLSPTLQ